MDKDNSVVELKDTRVVSDELVDLLEEVLKAAKNGEIISGGVVTVHHDNLTGNAFAGGNPMLLIAELMVLQRDIIDCQVDLRMHEAGLKY